VRQGYNKIAENYLAGRDHFKNDKYLDRLNTLLAPKSTILDLGCGSGIPIDSDLTGKGHKIIGTDISERQIELARENVPDGDFRIEDMSELRAGAYRVDAVVSFYAIFHTAREKHQDILNKINSFLKKDGFILITMGSSDWEGIENDFFGGEMYWSHFDAKTNRQLVENAGFKVLLDEIDTAGEERHQVILAQKITELIQKPGD
jgi:cyclopropane fatty-acyl-phospholipid synthase-like methyltransferase